MINPQNLSVLLRVLRASDGLARGASPTPAAGPVSAAAAVHAGDREAAQAQAEAAGRLLTASRLGMPVATDDPRTTPTQDEATAPAGQRRADAAPASAAGRGIVTASVAAAPGTPPAVAAAITTAVALSPAGAMLQEALRVAPEVASEPAIRPAQPLLARPPGDPLALAQALDHTVRESGLFYESHVVAWADAGHPRAALDREPQARWQAPAEVVVAAVADGPATAVATPLLSADAAVLVRHQLDTLDERRFTWSGELWPGQRGTLTFAEETRADERDAQVPDASPGAPRWSTELALDVPHLGRVVARIDLAGDRVRCRVQAASGDAAAALEAARPDLAQALAARALSLDACAVDHAAV